MRRGDTMRSYINKFSEIYKKRFLRFTDLDKKEHMLSIDFNKSWWHILWQHKWTLAFVFSGVIVSTATMTLFPLFIKSVVSSKKYSYILILGGVWLLIESWRPVTAYFFARLLASIAGGVRYSAYRFFLTVDPICHSNRVSGQIVSKIQRGTKATFKFLDNFIYQIFPMIVSLVVVVLSFFAYQYYLGLVALCCVLLLIIFNVSLVLFNSYVFEKPLINAIDSARASSIESLMQVNLVRASFATNEIESTLQSKNSYFSSMFGTYWFSLYAMMFLAKAVYVASVSLLGLYIIYLINSGQMSVFVGATFLLTYLNGTRRSMRIGMKLQRLVQATVIINDLFAFIRTFGKQTFPVLQADMSEYHDIPSSDVIALGAYNVRFSYKKIKIFDGHTLHMEVPYAQKNKMYGIIGPSGVGKTTLISILGGQIRPEQGIIELNKVPIYKINDTVRRKMIAIQGQSATSLSGTLRDSLLIGVPRNSSVFTDEYMQEVLDRVGIWHIFKNKGGLYAEIGEGGLNLSVGQRQRLNFASLYLRTKYYKPLLVMIDEPTSSLDEVSEQAITDMIDEIAENALVFVIAHRLGTLDEAVGILDFSLLGQEKDLVFHSRDELMKKSDFYRKLRAGEVAIEE